MILQAIILAEQAHRGQKRKYSDEPYIVHPLRVAQMVSKWAGGKLFDSDYDIVVTAALLHDVLEDTMIDPKVIEIQFGEGVFKLVNELTNPPKESVNSFGNVITLNRAARKAAVREKLFGVSLWAKVIKMFDRIDNLKDMATCPDADFRKSRGCCSRQLPTVTRMWPMLWRR